MQMVYAETYWVPQMFRYGSKMNFAPDDSWMILYQKSQKNYPLPDQDDVDKQVKECFGQSSAPTARELERKRRYTKNDYAANEKDYKSMVKDVQTLFR